MSRYKTDYSTTVSLCRYQAQKFLIPSVPQKNLMKTTQHKFQKFLASVSYSNVSYKTYLERFSKFSKILHDRQTD